LSWSVRGIYEGYVGYFDLNPATMYEMPAIAIYPDLTRLAGGANAIAKLAAEKLQQEKVVEALHLCDVALAAEAAHKDALQTKLKALEWLRDHCKNSNERGWLDFSVNQVKKQIAEKYR
jgi:alkyl sulfatase BDS1-like metallo-beta-lactamase superfamily hydrolase